MPLGIAIGRYSEHVKISTECSDDVELTEGENEPCIVRFIGQQNVPLYNSKNISGMMYQIYNKHYSPINSFINLKKYELIVDTTGISVYLASSKKGTTRNLFMSYQLTDILLVTSDYQHERLFAIIYYGTLRNCVLHLYLCHNEDDVKNIMNKCSDEFANNREIKQIEKSPYSDGLEIIHYKPYEKAKDDDDDDDDPDELNLTEILKENTTVCDEMINIPSTLRTEHTIPMVDIRDFKIPYNNGKVEKTSTVKNDDTFNFGAFQMVPSVTTTIPIATTNLPNRIPDSPQEQVPYNTQLCSNGKVNLMDDDDFEDEFEKLALKRNVYIPEHLQDKSIESTLLFPDEHLSQPSNEQSIKPGFFSSYNKLQS